MLKKRIARGLRVSRYVIYKETFFDFKDQIWSFIGAFVGIGLIAFFQSLILPQNENLFLIGSFGASSVLIFGAIKSPLSQPRNLIFGHIISAFIGVSLYKIWPQTIWLSAPLAVSLSIVAMQITKTLHPPGGATALIAIIGSEKIKTLGYFFVISPVMTGTLILFLVALLFRKIKTNKEKNTQKRLIQSTKEYFLKRKPFEDNFQKHNH